MKIKLCGIRNLEMLEYCKNAPVDFLGINFVPWSRRKNQIKSIPSPSFNKEGNAEQQGIKKSPLIKGDLEGFQPPGIVGIFADQEISEIAKYMQEFNLDTVQLHGDESPEYVDELRKALSLPSGEGAGMGVWKAFKINEKFDFQILQKYCKNTDLFLFDGSKPGSGTQISDNEKLTEAIAESERLGIPYGIAGGINADNIGEYLKKIPNATLLDTASGLEIDGLFSAEETERLVENFLHPQITIRPYKSTDWDNVWDLHETELKRIDAWFADEAVRKERFADLEPQTIEQHYLEKGDFLLLEYREELIGMGALRPTDEENTAEIKRMRVKHTFQGFDIGELILKTLEYRAKKLGYTNVILDTAKAGSFYEKFGYTLYDSGERGEFEVFYYKKSLS